MDVTANLDVWIFPPKSVQLGRANKIKTNIWMIQLAGTSTFKIFMKWIYLSVCIIKHILLYFQLTNYIQKLIVDCDNLEERICVIQRSLEILVVLQELHNFNCIFSMIAALNSAAIQRIVSKIKGNTPNIIICWVMDFLDGVSKIWKTGYLHL